MNGHIYEKNMLKLVKISYYLYGDAIGGWEMAILPPTRTVNAQRKLHSQGGFGCVLGVGTRKFVSF